MELVVATTVLGRTMQRKVKVFQCSRSSASENQARAPAWWALPVSVRSHLNEPQKSWLLLAASLTKPCGLPGFSPTSFRLSLLPFQMAHRCSTLTSLLRGLHPELISENIVMSCSSVQNPPSRDSKTQTVLKKPVRLPVMTSLPWLSGPGEPSHQLCCLHGSSARFLQTSWLSSDPQLRPGVSHGVTAQLSLWLDSCSFSKSDQQLL